MGTLEPGRLGNLGCFARWACAALSLCGCAIPTAQFQSANSVEAGGFRLGGSYSTGLHLEETAYPDLDPGMVQTGGSPDKERAYRRPRILRPEAFNIGYLSAFSLHTGVGIGRGMELNASVSAALRAASGRLGLKYRFYRRGEGFAAAINPTALYAISEGGSAPDDEITDGQQTFLQYVLNDKEALGLELPLLMTWRTRALAYNLAPSLAYYRVDISKGFHRSLVGRHHALAAGLSFGTYLRAGDGGIGPEISVVVLGAPGESPIVNVNYGLGFSSDF